MTEQSWHGARLIPTSGINGAEEQERRATSALLAVLSAVKEFGRGFVKPFGAPAGNMTCFIEVPFLLGEQRLYPDGLIRVERGSKSWTALVEGVAEPAMPETPSADGHQDHAARASEPPATEADSRASLEPNERARSRVE